MEIINLTWALAISQGITSVEYGMGIFRFKIYQLSRARLGDLYTFAKTFAKILIAALIIHNLQFGLACNGSVHLLAWYHRNFYRMKIFHRKSPNFWRYRWIDIGYSLRQALFLEIKIYIGFNRRNWLLCLILIFLQPEVNYPSNYKILTDQIVKVWNERGLKH